LAISELKRNRAPRPRATAEDKRVCLKCHSDDYTEDNELWQCDNCQKVQHGKCILVSPMPSLDEAVEWCCDECFENCGDCAWPRCSLPKEQNLDKLITCDVCFKDYHFLCVGFSECPKESYVCCGGNEEQDEVLVLEAYTDSQEAAPRTERSRARARATSFNKSINSSYKEDEYFILLQINIYTIYYTFIQYDFDSEKWKKGTQEYI
jgi:hypothetical protein